MIEAIEHLAEALDEPALLTILALLSIAAAGTGIGMAYLIYGRESSFREWFLDHTRRPFLAWENAYWVDDVYGNLMVLPGKMIAQLAARFDTSFVDGIVNGVASVTARASSSLRPLQTGFVRNYGAALAAGIIGLAIWVLARGGF